MTFALHQVIVLKNFQEIEVDNIVSESMSNGEFAFGGGMETLMMLKLLTIIRRG